MGASLGVQLENGIETVQRTGSEKRQKGRDITPTVFAGKQNDVRNTRDDTGQLFCAIARNSQKNRNWLWEDVTQRDDLFRQIEIENVGCDRDSDIGVRRLGPDRGDLATKFTPRL